MDKLGRLKINRDIKYFNNAINQIDQLTFIEHFTENSE